MVNLWLHPMSNFDIAYMKHYFPLYVNNVVPRLYEKLKARSFLTCKLVTVSLARFQISSNWIYYFSQM